MGVAVAMAGSEGLVSVDYEVSGRVQGVFFRKYTQVRCGVVGRGPRDSWAGPGQLMRCGVCKHRAARCW